MRAIEPRRKITATWLETAMGQVVLCSLVCASVPFAGRAPIPRLVAGADDQSKTERDAQSSRQHRRLYLAVWFPFESVGDAELAVCEDRSTRVSSCEAGCGVIPAPNYSERLHCGGHLANRARRSGRLVWDCRPLTITILILKVSGIPMLEKKMAEHPDFAQYARSTSVFLPWFPER